MPICLVVDGSEVVRKVASRILFDMGCAADRAGSGSEALEYLAANPMPDVVIVAASLPDMQGEELVRALREMPDGRDASVVCSMIENRLGTQVRLKRAGADGFMLVPFDRASMTAHVGGFVEAAEEREASRSAMRP